MNKKKLDVVVKYFYPVAAGIEVNIMETYKVLSQMGWDVTIHTSNLDYTTGEILESTEEINGIKVIRYPLGFPCFKPKLPYQSTSLICLHNFDILPHFYIMLTALLHKLLGRKSYSIVLTPHGGFNPEWRVFSKLEAIIKLIYHYTIGVLLINLTVDKVRAVSEWEKKEMIKHGIIENKVEVISNGLEDEAFENVDEKASEKIKNAVENYGDYIIQIGRIYPIKNIETSIKALERVPNIKLVHMGPISDKKYLEQLKNLAQKIGVADRVIFSGVVRGIDKYYVIKHAKLMVHMAIWESFCNVVHEALSQGIPVIAANNTALTLLVKNKINGFVVETKDDIELSDKINFLLNPENKKLVEEISQNNLRGAKNNTWKKTAEKMNSLYLHLVKG